MELEEGRLVQELKEVGKLRKSSGGSQGSPGRLRQTPTSKKGSYQTDDSTLQWRQLELHSKQRSMRTECRMHRPSWTSREKQRLQVSV